MLVDVPYKTNVFARVDTETRTVTRVIVDDEGAKVDPDYTVATPDGVEVPAEEGKRAIEIAEDPRGAWPAWEFGF
jgi:hypothetical protein